ncbi:hypothetical protein, partial [Capnocytophaga leadbetteri]|uniref:hypothetical protein n=1 Tax=Capnocytophaga leadbetteri TaxID=327575 RepID=UPI003C74B993
RPQPWQGCALPTELFSLVYFSKFAADLFLICGAKVQQISIPANFFLLFLQLFLLQKDNLHSFRHLYS